MVVLLIVSMPIVVKVDVELGKRVLQDLVILLIGLLWCQTLFLRFHNDRCTVCVRTTDERDIYLHLLQESDKHVGRHVGPKVTNVHLAACIWKSACYKHWIFGWIVIQFSHTPLDIS